MPQWYQVEVCARALLGLTSEAIGLDLGVKPTTITTHRKRAYAKLNISTANELFALCLGHVTAASSGPNFPPESTGLLQN